MLNTVYRLTQPRKIEIAFTEIDLFKPEVVVKPTYLSICATIRVPATPKFWRKSCPWR